MTALDTGEQVLFIGYNAAYLRTVEEKLPHGSVVVIEDPDIIRKRGPETWRNFDCWTGCPPSYHQSTRSLRGRGRVGFRASRSCGVPGLEYGSGGRGHPGRDAGAAGGGRSGRRRADRQDAAARRLQAGGVRNPQLDGRCTGRRTSWSSPPAVRWWSNPPIGTPAGRAAAGRVARTSPPHGRSRVRPRTSMCPTPIDWRYLAERRLSGPSTVSEALVRGGIASRTSPTKP